MSTDIINTSPPPYIQGDAPVHQPSTETHVACRIHRYGIFSVAFDPVSWLAPEGIYALHEFFVNIGNPIKFMIEVFWLSPSAFMWFLLCQALHPLMSTVHILTLYRAFGVVERIVQARFEQVQDELRMLWLCAALSVLCSVCCTMAFEQVLACRRYLGNTMRRVYTPIMVSASLHPGCGEAAKRVLPYESGYALFIPGWDQLYNFTTQVRNVMEVILHTLAFVCILLDTKSWALRVVVAVTIVWLLHLQIYPSFWTRGYAFWSHNDRYRRLGNLYRTIFSQDYHEYFKREGITNTVEKEYKRQSERVFRSTADGDTWHLLSLDPMGPLLRYLPCFVQPIGFALLVSYPSLAPSVIALMGTFPFAFTIVSSGVDRLTTLPLGSLNSARRTIDDFLEFLDSQKGNDLEPLSNGYKEKPLSENLQIEINSSQKSMDLSMQVNSGELVVVVADEEHRQATILRSVSGQGETEGINVTINGTRLSNMDEDVYRKSTVFVTDSDDTLLPGTLHDNLIWTVNLLRAEAGMSPIELNASDYRFCNSVLDGICEGNPHTVLKLEDCDVTVDTGYTYSVGKHAMAARRQHERPSIKPWDISKEDRQLISITRAFLKAKYGPYTKLVVFDDAANAFDAMTERRIFEAFSAVASSSGQTLIYSTRRFRGVAEKAKQVLFIRPSEQHATQCHTADHDTLYRGETAYKTMYDAQCSSPI